jgi:hypothetical protein
MARLLRLRTAMLPRTSTLRVPYRPAIPLFNGKARLFDRELADTVTVAQAEGI